MQNFLDCMRTRKEPNCPFEIGLGSAIACYMAITSYREKRTVRCGTGRLKWLSEDHLPVVAWN